MIQQGGYGQIYGNMGGGAVGASIFSAARESVNFARMVERQRLNLQQRQLRMQEAQMAANADLSKRRLDLEDTRLQLESRRLDLQDRLRKEEKERTLRAYDAKMEELARREEEAWMKAEEQARKEQMALEQRAFENGMAVTRGGGNIMDKDGNIIDADYNYLNIPGTGNLARVPINARQAAGSVSGAGTGGETARASVADKRMYESVLDDIKLDEKQASEARAALSKMRERIEELRSAAEKDDTAQAELAKAQAEYEDALKVATGGVSGGVSVSYRDAWNANPRLAETIPYNIYKGLPWGEWDDEQKGLVKELAGSRNERDMQLLKAIADKKDEWFNVPVARAWRSAAAKLGDKVDSPTVWMKKYKDVIAGNGDNGAMANWYIDAMQKDGTLLEDVDFERYEELTNGLVGEKDDKRVLVKQLVDSDSPYDRGILAALVDKGDAGFNLSAVEAYRKAIATDGAAAKLIAPDDFLAVDWNALDGDERATVEILLEGKGAEVGQKLREWVSRQTGRLLPTVENAPAEKTPVAEVKKDASAWDKGRRDDSGYGYIMSDGDVVLMVGGKSRKIPKDVWNKMTDAAWQAILEKVERARKGIK